jgi:PKD repeat protein
MKSLKGLMLLMLMLASLIGIKAQNLNWVWASGGGGMGSTRGQSIAADNLGNQYVTGIFYGITTIGSTTLSSNGVQDIFVAKIDTSGNWLWAISAGGSNSEESWSIVLDTSDHIYITGYFSGTAFFGSTALTSSGSTDIFIAKIDNNGNWLWAKRAGGADGDIGAGIAIDNDSNIYLTGNFVGIAVLGSTTITSNGEDDIYVAKLDGDGNWLWAISAGGINRTTSQGIALDSSANIYLTGQFTGTTYFDTTALVSSGGYDLYVAKMDSSGNWLWAVKADGVNDGVGYDIAIGPGSGIYVIGWFDGTATYGSSTITSLGSCDVFISKLTSDGNWLWTKRAGGTGIDYGYSISVDNAENILLTGSFRDTAYFGSTSLTSIPSGWADIFVVKLDSNGNFTHVVQAGGTGWDVGHGVVVDSQSNLYVTGEFSGTAYFGTNTLTTNANFTMFVAKLESPLTALFTVDTTQGMEPLTVQFTDQSLPGLVPFTNWFWTFGDGETSTLQHPSHTYLTPGVYTVSLTVLDSSYQSSTLVRPDYIAVIERVQTVDLISNAILNFGSVYLEEQ